MNVGVCFAEADRQVWLRLEAPDGSTVEKAIHHSGILNRFPEIDLTQNKVGIFGKLVKLDEGGRPYRDYRPITADPKTVRRRRMDDDDEDDDD